MVQVNFNQFDSPSNENVCYAVANSRSDVQSCFGMWPVFMSSGGAVIGFCNNLSNFAYGVPYLAQATASFGYDTNPRRYFLSVSLRADALMYRLDADNVVGAWFGGATSGQNWVLESMFSNGPFFATHTYREVNGPTIRQSKFSVLAQFGISSDPRWCTWPVGGGYRYVMSATTGYTIYDDDPLWRTKRTFDMWIPDPALDGTGVTLGVSATLNTAA